jgi:hypothetical protein
MTRPRDGPDPATRRLLLTLRAALDHPPDWRRNAAAVAAITSALGAVGPAPAASWLRAQLHRLTPAADLAELDTLLRGSGLDRHVAGGGVAGTGPDHRHGDQTGTDPG